MERFQGLCDSKTGHDPFKPQGRRKNLNYFHYIGSGFLLFLIGLLNILSVIIKIIVVPLSYLFGFDGTQISFKVTKWSLWKPLASAMGIHPILTGNMLSETEVSTSIGATDQLKNSDIVFGVLTSPSDIIYWILASNQRPIFIFGVQKGGFILVDSLLKALKYSCEIKIDALKNCETFKSENKRIDESSYYFSGMGPLMSYLTSEKNYINGPVIIYPQTQSCNGTALIPWTKNLYKSYSQKMENDFLHILKSGGTSRRYFISICVFHHNGTPNNRCSYFPNTLDTTYDYIVRQMFLGYGLYNTTIINVDKEVKDRFNDIETISAFERIVGDIQIEAYRRCFQQYHSSDGPLVTSGFKLHRCEDVKPNAGQQYKEVFFNSK